MLALIRYNAATMLHSQRYVAPVLLFMGIVGVLSLMLLTVSTIATQYFTTRRD